MAYKELSLRLDRLHSVCMYAHTFCELFLTLFTDQSDQSRSVFIWVLISDTILMLDIYIFLRVLYNKYYILPIF